MIFIRPLRLLAIVSFACAGFIASGFAASSYNWHIGTVAPGSQADPAPGAIQYFTGKTYFVGWNALNYPNVTLPDTGGAVGISLTIIAPDGSYYDSSAALRSGFSDAVGSPAQFRALISGPKMTPVNASGTWFPTASFVPATPGEYKLQLWANKPNTPMREKIVKLDEQIITVVGAMKDTTVAIEPETAQDESVNNSAYGAQVKMKISNHPR